MATNGRGDELPTPVRVISYIAPLAFAHVIPNGTYHFERMPTSNLPTT